ncbi:DUF2164 domain-containing protein [Vibrio maerlii]|uniref:DUF2164 domain-containing protein n=1 Tax=Vibrio maerlii TaxID=2231648 RepID=UPI000E3BCA41|nr:DUF2164 domain-containing protein [Vibrio maerlii]
MDKIEISRQEKTELAQKLQQYCEDELDIDVGQFDAEFIVDHLAQSLGKVIYNQALEDVQKVIDKKFMDINDEIYQLEKFD